MLEGVGLVSSSWTTIVVAPRVVNWERGSIKAENGRLEGNLGGLLLLLSLCPMTKSRSISSVYASVRRCERVDVISFYKVSPQPQPSEEEIVSFQLSLVSKNWLRALIYLWSSEVGLASLVKDVFKQWRDRRRPSRQQLLEKK